MERVLCYSTFQQDAEENAALVYWLSRPPEERIAEVERLRREYMTSLRGAQPDGCPEGLCRSLLVVEREGR